jgi:hypothetical protein
MYQKVNDNDLEARVGIEPTHKGFAVFRTSRKPLQNNGISVGYLLKNGHF